VIIDQYQSNLKKDNMAMHLTEVVSIYRMGGYGKLPTKSYGVRTTICLGRGVPRIFVSTSVARRLSMPSMSKPESMENQRRLVLLY
jgi:hypothetical protein